MKKMKEIMVVAMLIMGISTPILAQEAEFEPSWFVGVQGGVQNTLNKDFNNKKTFTPTAAFSLGRFFSPEVGARINFNGIWNKGTALSVLDAESTPRWNYKYLTSSADVLVNLCNMFGKKDVYPVNLYYIMGVGLYHAWDASEAGNLGTSYRLTDTEEDKRNAFNGRMGLQLAVNLCKHLDFNIEGTYNMHAGDHKTFAKDNHQFVLLAGLNFKFGCKAKPVEEPQWATRVDTTWYDDAQVRNVTEDGKMTWEVFYEIRESDFNAEAQLAHIGRFLKEYHGCKVDIKSYADVQTGNPRINMEYSKQRSEKAVQALVNAGVSVSAITANYYGDTVQPYAENDKNRVTIITATGLKDVKKPYTVRKFRTEEVRYRVD